MARSEDNGFSLSAPAGPVWSVPGLLLLPQVCLLAAIAGILCLRNVWAGIFLFCLILILDWGRTQVAVSRPRKIILLALCFIIAFGYAFLRQPSMPEVPEWLAQAAYPSEDADGEIRPPGPVTVRAEVVSTAALAGGRHRTILKDMVPAEGNEAPYSGNVVWTLYHDRPPLPGQIVEAKLRLLPVRGMANPGTWDTEQYWHDRNVWFRAWSSRSDPPVGILPQEESWEIRLSHVRAGLLRTLLDSLDRREGLQEPPEPDAHIRGSAAAILPALIFGDRSYLSQEQTDLFTKGTLAHSLALSGLHLGFAVLAGYFVARFAGFLVPSLWLRITRPKLALLLSLPLGVLYLWLGQAPVSLQRAFCMLCFWALLLFFNRPRVLLDGLSAAVALLLILNPLSLFDLGLQLSALSIVAIALCLPTIQRLSRRIGRQGTGISSRFVRIGRGAFAIASLSLCIQVALFPITTDSFGTTGLLFPLNILWLPVLGVVVLPLAFLGLALGVLGLTSVAALVLYIAELPCQALMAVLQWLDGAGLLAALLLPRPHWIFWAGYWLLLVSIPAILRSWNYRPKKRRKRQLAGSFAVAFAALCMMVGPVAGELWRSRIPGVSLTLIDVGQGQAVLLEWTGLGPERQSGRALVDGGGFSSPYFDVGKAVVAPVLTRQSLPRLDVVMNSHPDADHLAGLIYILGNFRVGAYYTNGDTPSPGLAAREEAALRSAGIPKKTLRTGDVLHLAPDLTLEVLWPPSENYDVFAGQGKGSERGNNASLIVRLVWQGKPLALMCGDAEKPALEALLEQMHGADALNSDVLVLPHHGAASSHVPDLYRAVNPKMALASSGYANRWSFPRKAVRQSLEEMHIPLYGTAVSGQIRLTWEAPDQAPELYTAR